ncbi:MAG TPA: hypothetical protein VIG30_17435 [Ktedonobacterales bacterium]
MSRRRPFAAAHLVALPTTSGTAQPNEPDATPAGAPRHEATQDAVPREARPSATLAGLRLLLGYSWLAAGADKLLLGTFPAGLNQLLLGTLRGGNIPGWFASLLRAAVLPHGVIVGVLVESGEALAGLALLASGLLDLLAPPLERRLSEPLARPLTAARRVIGALAVAAAAATVFIGLSYYLLDGAPFQGLMPSIAFDGAISPPLLLALGAVVSLAEPLHAWLAHRAAAWRGHAGVMRQIGAHHS